MLIVVLILNIKMYLFVSDRRDVHFVSMGRAQYVIFEYIFIRTKYHLMI